METEIYSRRRAYFAKDVRLRSVIMRKMRRTGFATRLLPTMQHQSNGINHQGKVSVKNENQNHGNDEYDRSARLYLPYFTMFRYQTLQFY